MRTSSRPLRVQAALAITISSAFAASAASPARAEPPADPAPPAAYAAPPPAKPAPGRRGLRKALIISGAVTLGLGYTGSAVMGVLGIVAGDDGSTLWPMLLPVFGPFATIGSRGSHSPWSNEAVGLLVADGLFQTVGASLLVAGLLLPGGPSGPAAASSPAPFVTLAPMTGNGRVGLTVVGAF